MIKAAKKNNINIAINLNELIKSQTKEKAEIIARIKQNIKLCNKNKVKMAFLPCKNEKQCKALSLSLGMPSWMFFQFK